jgi:hypothetical protein
MNKLKLNHNIINIIHNYLMINKNEIKIIRENVLRDIILNTFTIKANLDNILFHQIKNTKIISQQYEFRWSSNHKWENRYSWMLLFIR